MMRTPLVIKKLLPGKKVGISASDLNGDADVVIEVEQRGKTGRLMYPYLYKIEVGLVAEFAHASRHGIMYYAVPLGRFKKIAKRAELVIIPPPC
jgi:hypothetical protein